MGRWWELRLGAVDGFIYKVALEAPVASKQDAMENLTVVSFALEKVLGAPTQQGEGLSVWNADDGNVVLQLAQVRGERRVMVFFKSSLAQSGGLSWRRLSSSQEHFTAIFPGKAERQFFGFFPDDGRFPGTIVYSRRLSRLFLYYEVRVTRVPGYSGSPRDFLEDALGELVASINEGVLADSNAATFKGLPALRFRLTVGLRLEATGLAALDGNSLYVLSVLHPPGAEHEFERFCGGFEIQPSE
jgi:hypothetical protein